MKTFRVCMWNAGILIAALAPSFHPEPAFAQGTAFTYQGRLNDGSGPATGIYDLQFTVYDGTNSQAAVIAGPLTNSATAVSNGLFTVSLDFGAGVFTGGGRWLELAVRTNFASGFITLSPRQAVASSPYAIMAGSVASGGIANGTYNSAVNFDNGANEFDGSYSGNGAGLTNVSGTLKAQAVAGTNVLAAPNTSYVLTNDSLVSITLPSSPAPGDTLRIAATGESGWQLLQNPGQVVLCANLVGGSGDWSQVETNFNNDRWLYLACSPDGLHLAASGVNQLRSEDGGATWTNFSGFPSSPLCESADGSMIAEAAPPGIVIFTNYASGYATVFSALLKWSGIVGAPDFSHLAVTVNGGGIYYYPGPLGTNWATSDAPATNWVAVAASVDMSHLAAAVNSGAPGGIYVSTDFGMHWTSTTATNQLWNCLASSADGSHLAAGGPNGIYTSADFGTSWSLSGAPTNVGWWALASSADGTRLVATGQAAGVYTSTDSGATWTQAKLPATGNWTAAASSAAGTFVVGDHAFGGLYQYKAATSTGSQGYLSGVGNTAITLEYMGNGSFLPVSHEGTLVPH